MKYKENSRNQKIHVSLEIIHECVAEYFGVTKACIFLKSRADDIAIRRQWFHYFARTLNPLISFAYIGSYYSDRTYKKYDHNTIRHSITTIKNQLDISGKDRVINMELKLLINSRFKQKTHKKPLICTEQQFKINRYYENNSAHLT